MAIRILYNDTISLSSLVLKDIETNSISYCFFISKKKYSKKNISFFLFPKNVKKIICSFLEEVYINIPLYFATKNLKVFPNQRFNIQDIRMKPSFKLREYQEEALMI